MATRKQTRLTTYDYSEIGAYFVTICSHKQKPLFGNITSEKMQINEIGKIIDACWKQIPLFFPDVSLDEYIIMPNHLHGILHINKRANNYSPLQKPETQKGTSRTLGSIIRGFKTGVTKTLRKQMNIQNIWQRSFYDHIIRTDEKLQKIQEYIINNPAKWQEDKYYL